MADGRGKRSQKKRPGVGKDGKCGAVRKGKKCTKPAGWGTEHVGVGACRIHGGNAPGSVKAAQRTQAIQAVETYGLPRDVSPHDALLEELARTAGHVQWLGQIVASLEDGQVVGPVGTEGIAHDTGLEHHAKYEASVWVRLYQEERGHLAQVAATCIKVGIEERRVRLAEEQGQLIAKVINGVLSELKVAPEKARPVVRKHLALVAGEQA